MGKKRTFSDSVSSFTALQLHFRSRRNFSVRYPIFFHYLNTISRCSDTYTQRHSILEIQSIDKSAKNTERKNECDYCTCISRKSDLKVFHLLVKWLRPSRPAPAHTQFQFHWEIHALVMFRCVRLLLLLLCSNVIRFRYCSLALPLFVHSRFIHTDMLFFRYLLFFSSFVYVCDGVSQFIHIVGWKIRM